MSKRARRRRGSVFYGCNRYPECDFTVGQRPLAEPCPECASLMVAQRNGDGKCTSCGRVVEGAAEPSASAGAGEGDSAEAG